MRRVGVVFLVLPLCGAGAPAPRAIDSPVRPVAAGPLGADPEFEPDPAGLAQLRAAHGDGAAVTLRGFELPGRRVDLDLQPFSVTPDAFTAVVVAAGGERRIAPRVAAFRGRIAGEPGYAFLVVTPGRINGYVLDRHDRSWIVSSGDPREVAARVTITAGCFAARPGGAWTCATAGGSAASGAPEVPQPASAGPHVRIADMFIEADHELRGLFATAEETAEYVLTLFAVTADIYRRDLGATMRIPDGYLRVWEVEPPWGVADQRGEPPRPPLCVGGCLPLLSDARRAPGYVA